MQVDVSAAAVQRDSLRAARRTHPDVLPDADEADRDAAAEAVDRLGGSLVVPVPLAFLLIGVISAEQASIGDPLRVPTHTSAP